mmetsp:Transcript_11947/g.35402  ORF Transcript_11947/g.35402 Transcript_11947/m.35402 type:complete len:282 (-) Transcript_11947:5543-6388(-)
MPGLLHEGHAQRPHPPRPLLREVRRQECQGRPPGRGLLAARLAEEEHRPHVGLRQEPLVAVVPGHRRQVRGHATHRQRRGPRDLDGRNRGGRHRLGGAPHAAGVPAQVAARRPPRRHLHHRGGQRGSASAVLRADPPDGETLGACGSEVEADALGHLRRGPARRAGSGQHGWLSPDQRADDPQVGPCPGGCRKHRHGDDGAGGLRGIREGDSDAGADRERRRHNAKERPDGFGRGGRRRQGRRQRETGARVGRQAGPGRAQRRGEGRGAEEDSACDRYAQI